MAASYHILLLLLALSADAVPSWYGLLCVRGAPLLFEEEVSFEGQLHIRIRQTPCLSSKSDWQYFSAAKGFKVNIACCA
jgi:hypothetical protein